MDFFVSAMEIEPDGDHSELVQQCIATHDKAMAWKRTSLMILPEAFRDNAKAVHALRIYDENMKDLEQRVEAYATRIEHDEDLIGDTDGTTALLLKLVDESITVSNLYTEILELQLEEAFETPFFEEYGIHGASVDANLLFRRAHQKVAMTQLVNDSLATDSTVTVEEISGLNLGCNINDVGKIDIKTVENFVSDAFGNNMLSSLFSTLENFIRFEESVQHFHLQQKAMQIMSREIFKVMQTFALYMSSPGSSIKLQDNPGCHIFEWLRADVDEKASKANQGLVAILTKFPEVAVMENNIYQEIWRAVFAAIRIALAARMGVDVSPLEELGRFLLLPVQSAAKYFGAYAGSITLPDFDKIRAKALGIKPKYDALVGALKGPITTIAYNSTNSTYIINGDEYSVIAGDSNPIPDLLHTLESAILLRGATETVRMESNDTWNLLHACTQEELKREVTPFDLTKDSGNGVAIVIKTLAHHYAYGLQTIVPLIVSPVVATMRSSTSEILRSLAAAMSVTPTVLISSALSPVTLTGVLVMLHSISTYGGMSFPLGVKMLLNLYTASTYTDCLFRFGSFWRRLDRTPFAVAYEPDYDNNRVRVTPYDELDVGANGRTLRWLRAAGFWENVNSAIGSQFREHVLYEGVRYNGTISRTASAALAYSINSVKQRYRSSTQDFLQFLRSSEGSKVIVGGGLMLAATAEMISWLPTLYHHGVSSLLPPGLITDTTNTVSSIIYYVSDDKAQEIIKQIMTFGGFSKASPTFLAAASAIAYMGGVGATIASAWRVGKWIAGYRTPIVTPDEPEKKVKRRNSEAPRPMERNEPLEQHEPLTPIQERRQIEVERLDLTFYVLIWGVAGMLWFIIKHFIGSNARLMLTDGRLVAKTRKAD